MISVTLLMLMIPFADAASNKAICNASGRFRKVGCFKRNENLLTDLLITDLDPTHDKWGTHINWDDYATSLRSIACRCWEKAHANFSYFAIGFYGECWAGKDKVAVEKKILNPGAHASTSCVDGGHVACNHKSKQECVGTADNEYIYEIISKNIGLHPQGAPKTAQCDFTSGKGIGGSKIMIGVMSKSACVDNCIRKKQEHKGINGVTFRSSTGHCWCEILMNNIDVAEKSYQTCLIGGSKGGCEQKNLDYFTPNLRSFTNINSWEICSSICRSFSGCRAWTWISETFYILKYRRICVLKSSTNKKKIFPNLISGKRDCGNDTPIADGRCKEDNIDYYGYTLASYPKFDSWRKCSSLCANIRECRGWTWVPDSFRITWVRLSCFLKYNTRGRRVTPGLLSGKKNCEMK